MKSCPTCHRTYPDDTLAFCLVDGSVLSPPYDSEQTQRMPTPRVTNPPVTELPGATQSRSSRPPLQSTIHAAAPRVPVLYPQRAGVDSRDVSRKSILPWLLISAAILLVGIFGVVMIASRLAGSGTSSQTSSSPSPTPTSTVVVQSTTICGQVVSPGLLKKWNELGGETGKMGCPINQESDAPASPQGTVGRWIQFAKGDGGYLIEHTRREYQTKNVTPDPFAGHVFEVSGCMFKLYASLGGTKSWLGFPIGDGYETDPGARQQFEGGYIVWDRKTYVCEAHK